MLYPINTQVRERHELSGVWRFAKVNDSAQCEQYCREGLPLDSLSMPVPASYNDLTQDVSLRDHIGEVVYETAFYIPKSWKEKRTVLRFGSVTHHAGVWLNGEKIASHKGGFMPFEVVLTEAMLAESGENRLCVAVDNRLDWTCLPPGEIKTFDDRTRYPEGYQKQIIHFDFFNYAGIHRPVVLYSTEKIFIEDISFVTQKLQENQATLSLDIEVSGSAERVQWNLQDAAGVEVASGTSCEEVFTLDKPNLWEPGVGYLYDLNIYLYDAQDNLCDHYTLPVGIRTVGVSGKTFMINDKPFEFKGFGKHEDAALRGRAMDYVTLVKDFELMRWMGANSFRTAHYPYAEEVYRLADRLGIVVIDEVPAVGMNVWNAGAGLFSDEFLNDETLQHHIEVSQELVARDKNHPCVVMWSAANECATWEEAAVPYFEKVTKAFRDADPTRPLIVVENDCFGKSLVTHLFDVIGVNRYDTWYADPGCLDLTALHMREHLERDWATYGKPVLLAEVGADAIPGLHADPPTMFSEEFQAEMLEITVHEMAKLDFVIGTHVWNFADFATKQGLTRVGGNRKGVFTRDRQPKIAAHTLRKLWK